VGRFEASGRDMQNKKQVNKLACQARTLEIWQSRHSDQVKLPIPIDYMIYFRVNAGTRSTVLGGDSVWVSGLVIGSSRSSLVVLWGTMVEMVELHIVVEVSTTFTHIISY
jgi:hypothetical protein